MTAFDRWRAEGRTLDFRGHTVFYRREHGPADGRHLLLIHGFPTASWDFHRLWPTLIARNAVVLAPDMLGFGWSDKPAGHRYRIAEQADLHEHLLRHCGVARVWIVAHDYGVTVAQELLARFAERRTRGDDSLHVDGVCFLNGGLFPESHRARLVQRLLLSPAGPLLSRLFGPDQFRSSFMPLFVSGTKPSEGELREFWQLIAHRHGARQLHRLLHYIPERRQHRDRWVGALERTDVPIRLIAGLDDPVSGAHMVARYRQVVPRPDVVELAGIGHYPHVEAPALVLSAIDGWMNARL